VDRRGGRHRAARRPAAAGPRWPAAALAYADAGSLGLGHALVGETIVSRLGPAERADWHERLARALEGESVDLDRLARHWAQAGATERAAALGRAALDDLRARGASRRAFACYEIALRPPAAVTPRRSTRRVRSPQRASASTTRCASGSPPPSGEPARPVGELAERE
jgi:hypothetical protein